MNALILLAIIGADYDVESRLEALEARMWRVESALRLPTHIPQAPPVVEELPRDPAPPRRSTAIPEEQRIFEKQTGELAGNSYHHDTQTAVIRKYVPQSRDTSYKVVGNYAAHLVSHGFDPTIFRNNTRQEWEWLHADAHEGRRKVITTVVRPMTVAESNTATQVHLPNGQTVTALVDDCPDVDGDGIGDCPTKFSMRYQSTFKGGGGGVFGAIGRALKRK